MKSRIAALALLTGGLVLAHAGDAQAYTLKTLYSFCAPASCNDDYSFVYYGPILGTDGNLYGLTYGAGAHKAGMVYRLAANGSDWRFKDIYDFCSAAQCADGYWPMSGLIQDQDGNLYGTLTSNGVSPGTGSVFKLSHNGRKWKLRTLYQFCSEQDCADGRSPYGPLTYVGAQAGLPYDGTSPLYGVANGGGQDLSVAYSLTSKRKRWNEKVVYRFRDDNFSNQGTLLADQDRKLYGATAGGFGSAALFELVAKKPEWKRKDLHHADSEGNGDLIRDASGALLGTIQGDGPNSGGTLYRLDPLTKDYQALHEFCSLANCADGRYASGGVKLDASGDVFGLTAGGGGHDIDDAGIGGGTVYRLHEGSLETLYAFCAQAGCSDGAYPVSTPALDASGRIFGATSGGGSNDGGTVFELIP